MARDLHRPETKWVPGTILPNRGWQYGVDETR